ncbi:hypothetical protein BGX30_012381 [Mortierella sp. GBA39]|nr:hypothetical protein BGX30_012381 [Mortierella sp. GBA39]
MFGLVVSPSAGAVSWVEYTTPEYGRDYYRCGFQKILCVEFDGWREDKPKVSFKFNGRWYRHKVENKQIPAFSNLN